MITFIETKFKISDDQTHPKCRKTSKKCDLDVQTVVILLKK